MKQDPVKAAAPPALKWVRYRRSDPSGLIVATFGERWSGKSALGVSVMRLPSGAQLCLTPTSRVNGVSWRRLVPSMLAVYRACPKSCPLKSTKLSFVPSGETSGLVTPLPVPVVIRWRSPPDRFMLQMASTLVLSLKRSKKILVPSGLNDGVASQPFRLPVRSVRPLPSAFMSITEHSGSPLG